MKQTQQYVLRAMARNYARGHNWDHLDSEAVTKAADEISALEATCTRLAEEKATWVKCATLLGNELDVLKAQRPFTYVTLLDGKIHRQGSESHCREWADAWNATESAVLEVGRATVEPLFRRAGSV